MHVLDVCQAHDLILADPLYQTPNIPAQESHGFACLSNATKKSDLGRIKVTVVKYGEEHGHMEQPGGVVWRSRLFGRLGALVSVEWQRTGRNGE
jgi:hypothetical protein